MEGGAAWLDQAGACALCRGQAAGGAGALISLPLLASACPPRAQPLAYIYMVVHPAVARGRAPAQLCCVVWFHGKHCVAPRQRLLCLRQVLGKA